MKRRWTNKKRTQICRFCSGRMHLTGGTLRPPVSEKMEMPLSSFRQAQVGAIFTLGKKLPKVQAEISGNESPPAMRKRTEEIGRHFGTLLTSTFFM